MKHVCASYVAWQVLARTPELSKSCAHAAMVALSERMGVVDQSVAVTCIGRETGFCASWLRSTSVFKAKWPQISWSTARRFDVSAGNLAVLIFFFLSGPGGLGCT